MSGWWCTYPSEKNERLLGWFPNTWKNKTWYVFMCFRCLFPLSWNGIQHIRIELVVFNISWIVNPKINKPWSMNCDAFPIVIIDSLWRFLFSAIHRTLPNFSQPSGVYSSRLDNKPPWMEPVKMCPRSTFDQQIREDQYKLSMLDSA